MDSHSLPLVRRGIRLVWLGLLVTLSPYLVLACCKGFFGGLPGMAEYVLSWVFAAGISTCLAGIALTTSAPRESGVPRWAFGILAGSTLASVWPMAVWGADLPAAAYPDSLETLIGVAQFFVVVAFTGLLAAVCRWFAADEPPRLPGGRAGVWTRLTRNTTWLFRAGCFWLSIVVALAFVIPLAMQWLDILFILFIEPLVMILQLVLTLMAPLWAIWFIVTAVRFERACGRSAKRSEDLQEALTPGWVRLGRLGLAAGTFAIVAFVAGWLMEEPMGEAWKKRHAAEIAARSEGQWVEMEMGDSDDSGQPNALSVDDIASPMNMGAVDIPPEPPAYRAVISENVKPSATPAEGYLPADAPGVHPAGALLEFPSGDSLPPPETEPTGDVPWPVEDTPRDGDASTPDAGTPDR